MGKLEKNKTLNAGANFFLGKEGWEVRGSGSELRKRKREKRPRREIPDKDNIYRLPRGPISSRGKQ